MSRTRHEIEGKAPSGLVGGHLFCPLGERSMPIYARTPRAQNQPPARPNTALSALPRLSIDAKSLLIPSYLEVITYTWPPLASCA